MFSKKSYDAKKDNFEHKKFTSQLHTSHKTAFFSHNPNCAYYKASQENKLINSNKVSVATSTCELNGDNLNKIEKKSIEPSLIKFQQPLSISKFEIPKVTENIVLNKTFLNNLQTKIKEKKIEMCSNSMKFSKTNAFDGFQNSCEPSNRNMNNNNNNNCGIKRFEIKDTELDNNHYHNKKLKNKKEHICRKSEDITENFNKEDNNTRSNKFLNSNNSNKNDEKEYLINPVVSLSNSDFSSSSSSSSTTTVIRAANKLKTIKLSRSSSSSDSLISYLDFDAIRKASRTMPLKADHKNNGIINSKIKSHKLGKAKTSENINNNNNNNKQKRKSKKSIKKQNEAKNASIKASAVLDNFKNENNKNETMESGKKSKKLTKYSSLDDSNNFNKNTEENQKCKANKKISRIYEKFDIDLNDKDDDNSGCFNFFSCFS